MGAVERYRSSRLHRNCLYCQHFHVKSVGIECRTLYLCNAKVKALEHPEMIRPFCPCFKLNEQKCLEDDPLVSILITSEDSEKINEVAVKLQDLIDKGDTYKILIGKEN